MLLSLCFVVLIVFLNSVLRVCFLWLFGSIPFALVDVMVQTVICAGIFASWFLLVGIISGYIQAAGAPSKREVVLRHQFLVPKPLFSALMSILGEVCISHLRCIQRHMQDDGHTEVFDISCRLTGNAGGQAPIRASIHVHTTTFDGEDWRLITLMCSHCARYETLFAPSCGSVGDFLDITQDVDGNLAIPADMRHYSLNVRRFTGEFYAHFFFLTPNSIEKPTPLAHCSFPECTRTLYSFNTFWYPCHVLENRLWCFLIFPNTGWKKMAPCVPLPIEGGEHRRRSNGCMHTGSALFPCRFEKRLVIYFTGTHRQAFNWLRPILAVTPCFQCCFPPSLLAGVISLTVFAC